jgi:hypothetical protein
VQYLYWRAYIEFAEGNARRSAELFEVGLSRRRQSSANPVAMLQNVAAVRLALGDIDGAESAAREAVELASYEPPSAWSSLWHWAAIPLLRGRPRVAARLFGFAKATSELLNRVNDPLERSSYDILMASLSEQLSPDTIEALQAEGAQLDLARAIDEALSLPPDHA